MGHVGAVSKAHGILVRILGPESTDARIFISMKNVSMCDTDICSTYTKDSIYDLALTVHMKIYGNP